MFRLLRTTTIVCVSFLLLLNKGETASKSVTTSQEITKEIDRFAEIQKVLKKDEIFISVRFSKVTKTDDDTAQYDRFELSSVSDKGNATEDDTKLTKNDLETIFFIANHFNVTAVVSSEKYSRNGELTSRHFHAEDVTIEFDNGATNIVYKNIAQQVQDEDEKSLESYINLMKGFELPVEVRSIVYDEEGGLLKNDFSKYEPKKVKILATNMPLDTQLLCAEVLKRTSILKKDTKDRLILVSKFLNIKKPTYSWEGVVGDASTTIKNHTIVLRAVLEGETYVITGTDKYIEEEE